jgi:hypothetical protein
MGMVRVLCSHGDDRYSWDQFAAMTGDPDAKAAVREAEHIFEQQRARGALAVRVTPRGPHQRIDQFDPEAEQIVLVPRVAGGATGRGEGMP